MSLQSFYDRAEAATRALKIANKLGMPYRARALSLYNKHMANLRRIQTGKKPLQRMGVPDMYSSVAGIPCGIVFDGLYAQHGWWVTDQRGYVAEWLERKMTQDDHLRIDDEVLAVTRKKLDWDLAE